jgi:transposase
VKKPLTTREKNMLRLDILNAHVSKQLSIKESAARLGMSVSGFKKLRARYRRLGESGLKHGLAGARPNRKTNPRRDEIVALANGKYKAFGISHARQMLEKREGVKTSRETLRRWLNESGRTAAKRKTRHKSWRQPKHSFGEMLQIDGSFHAWLDGETNICMINITDDATSTGMLHFDKEETVEAACLCLWRWVRTHGIPKSIYADLRNMYHLTANGRANFFNKMCRLLGIETVRAFSPQAKGRVERANGTHQKRLVPMPPPSAGLGQKHRRCVPDANATHCQQRLDGALQKTNPSDCKMRRMPFCEKQSRRQGNHHGENHRHLSRRLLEARQGGYFLMGNDIFQFFTCVTDGFVIL